MSANGQLYHPMNMPNADRLQTIEQETVYLLTSTAEELWDTAATVASSGQSTYDDWEAARASLSRALAQLQKAQDHKRERFKPGRTQHVVA